METGEQYQIQITAYTHNGYGVGTADGFVLMVPQTLLGECCLVSVTEVHKTYAMGTLLQVVTPSPQRRTPFCPDYTRCGGCDLQHMSYEETLRLKREVVCRTLTRIGGVQDGSVVREVLGMDEPYRYRNSMQYHADCQAEGMALGFYEKGSHRVIAPKHCFLQREETQDLYQAVQNFFKERKAVGVVHTAIRFSFATRQQMLIVVTQDSDLRDGEGKDLKQELIQYVREQVPSCVSIFLGERRKKGTGHKVVGNENRLLFGQPYLTETLGALAFHISPLSFFQVNTKQAEILYETVLELAGLTGKEMVADLYCGTGTISLFLAQKAKEVIGIEVVAEAVADAKGNQARNKVPNAQFLVGKAEDIFTETMARENPCQIVVVDPPRAGCDEKLLEAIGKSRIPRVVYVSCDPATLARDVRRLCTEGYTLKTVQPVDMFPWTKGIEGVALLEHNEGEATKR